MQGTGPCFGSQHDPVSATSPRGKCQFELRIVQSQIGVEIGIPRPAYLAKEQHSLQLSLPSRRGRGGSVASYAAPLQGMLAACLLSAPPVHHYTPLYSTIHHYTTLYTAIHHYAPLYTTLHQYTPLYATIHHYTPLYTTIRHYTTLYTAIRHYTSLYTTIHHYTPLYATIHHYTPLYTTIHHYTP
jgi:hypothetical protein